VDDASTLLSGQIDALSQRFEVSTATHQADMARMREMLRTICDREPWQRERLHALRATEGYDVPFADPQPLVSVVIPTFDNYRLLRERAIPSVLAQTYQHFEIVVVGDAAPAEAQEAVESFDDARLRYSNLTYRGPYPSEDRARWYVAGVPPYNEAVRLARGLGSPRLTTTTRSAPITSSDCSIPRSTNVWNWSTARHSGVIPMAARRCLGDSHLNRPNSDSNLRCTTPGSRRYSSSN
jgi:hypothetical protein